VYHITEAAADQIVLSAEELLGEERLFPRPLQLERREQTVPRTDSERRPGQSGWHRLRSARG
jgi:hypothetical protein